MLYSYLLQQQQHLETKIKELQKTLKTFPQEKLICARNGNRYKWYISNGKHRTYLPKKEIRTATKLAEKKYLTLQLEDLINEKKSIDAYLQIHHTTNLTEEFLVQNPEYQKLLASMYRPVSAELAAWSHTSYEKNNAHPEHLIHKSLSGNLLRSKSEVYIDTALFTNGIPFRYECALHLGEITLYPDFTILHPRTGQIYYWEHFGLMSNPVYAKNSCTKLHTYTSHGIIPTINLITTYETCEHPLTPDSVEKIVKEYFL